MKNPFKRKQRGRGKGVSPELKAKQQQAKTDAYLSNVWLKMLKQDPDLAARIAEQKFGVELSIGSNHEEGEYYEKPDLLEVLRQAKEARELVKDELGDSNRGGWVRDLAEILKVLPSAIQAVGQMQPPSGSGTPPQRIQQPPRQQISQPQQQREPEPDKTEQARMTALLPLLELEPQAAYEELKNQGEDAWVKYLKETSYDEAVSQLKFLESDPEYGSFVQQFLDQRGDWLEELVEIAHNDTE